MLFIVVILCCHCHFFVVAVVIATAADSLISVSQIGKIPMFICNLILLLMLHMLCCYLLGVAGIVVAVWHGCRHFTFKNFFSCFCFHYY